MPPRRPSPPPPPVAAPMGCAPLILLTASEFEKWFGNSSRPF